MSKSSRPSYESCIPVINEELEKRRARWTLSSIPSIDYDDVSQIIRFHIFVKWSQYDPALPLRNWVARIITNQTRNLVRNVYTNNAPVCNRCPANQGGGLCAFFGHTQVPECKVYKAWMDRKQEAFNIKLPLPLENHLDEVHSIPREGLDVEATATVLHARMKGELTPNEWRIYRLLFIEQRSEEETAEAMGYKTTEKSRTPGYHTLATIRKSIMEKVKRAVYGEDAIDFVF